MSRPHSTNTAYDFDLSDILLYLLAFVAPPVPVFLRYGLFSNQFLLNVLLTILFGLPGTIHSIYLTYKSSDWYVATHGPHDYERIIETHHHTFSSSETSPAQKVQDVNQGVRCEEAHNFDFNQGSSSKGDAVAPPPSYEESQSPTQNSTDNKVQRS